MTRDKVISAEEAVRGMEDGSTVAIGGMHGHNNPMAIVRELVRQGKRIGRLVVSPSASVNADLLIGGGLVDDVLAPYIGLEHLGLAPCFKRAAERGDIRIRECETSLIINGLRAGAAGVAFHPVAPGVETTSIPSLNAEDYKWVTDPFTGARVLCTPAINPDIAIVHCTVADRSGTALFGGAVFADWDMVRASKRAILMVEKVVDVEVPTPEGLLDEAHRLGIIKGERRSNHRVVPHTMVDAVVEAPLGCHPTASHRAYPYDEGHLRRYMEMARTDEGFAEYVERYIRRPGGQEGYRRLVIEEGAGKDGPVARAVGSASPTTTEVMITALARELNDGDVVIMGANSSIPLMACMLAMSTHAPGLTYLTGGAGGVNPRPSSIPLSSCADSLLEGPSTLELGDLIDAQVLRGVDVFFAGGLQVDMHGDLNLIGVGPHDMPSLRGPGTAGLSLFQKAGRIVVYMTAHTPRQFVGKVDHISGTGRPVNNVVKVISPLCVMDFDERDRMRLVSLHPGVRPEQVKEATGFELASPATGGAGDGPPVTPSPSGEELEVIRGLDPNGTVRNRVS